MEEGEDAWGLAVQKRARAQQHMLRAVQCKGETGRLTEAGVENTVDEAAVGRFSESGAGC